MLPTEPARSINRFLAFVWFVPVMPGKVVESIPVTPKLPAPKSACGVMLLSFHPVVRSRLISPPALKACLPIDQLSVSAYCQRGLTELRVEPNPAFQFIEALVPMNVVTGWKGMPLFTGKRAKASAPVPVGLP